MPQSLHSRIYVHGQYVIEQFIVVGGCRGIQQVTDIVLAARATPNVVFHSVNTRYPLIDFLYQSGEGHFHAFQATIGATHTANQIKIKQLQRKVGGWEILTLYYLVQDKTFLNFATRPANPQTRGVKCKIVHVLIQNPYDNDPN